MTRLAIVRQKYNPAGGAERFVSRALTALREQGGLEVSLIARKWEQVDGIRALLISPFYLGSLWRDWSFARAARRLWTREGFDLVQSHERIPGCDIFRAGDGVHRRWLQLRRRHLSAWGRFALWCNPYHHYVQRAEAAMFRHPRMRLVICNSEMVKREIQQDFGLPDERFAVVYNGVDTSAFHPDLSRHRAAMRAQWHVPEAAPLLVYVGSGFERKGVARALEQLRRLPELHLVVVGHDKRAGRYQRLAEALGVAQRVRFVGAQKDVKPFYGMADAFILPTLYDPFPNVCVEAMAAGLPVFTSDTCGAAEFVADGVNGWVASVAEPDKWQLGLQAWLADRERWPAWRAAAREAAEPLTLSAMAALMLRHYQALL